MKKQVVAIFDIGKTNKKIILFDKNLDIALQKEEEFPAVTDEDGYECDDIELIENWVKSSLQDFLNGSEYDVVAVNFSTYGASLVFLDENGKMLAPVYNYLKPISEEFAGALYQKYGGKEEFCRKTASPALGLMLNSGVQILWLKNEREEIFRQTKNILHFPQYLSFLLTNKITSESTSIGCHTFMWDFDNMRYHQWLEDEAIKLPQPLPNSTLVKVRIGKANIYSGIGIHDSSASLVPYLCGSNEEFVLVSTGTWCINMNPFNHTPLTADELKQDCLSYLSINQEPVKSSRLFMGHIHDVNTAWLEKAFNVPEGSYKKVVADGNLIAGYLNGGVGEQVFFKNGVPPDYLDNEVDLARFPGFREAYHRLMYDLALQCAKSLNLVLKRNDGIEKLFVSGGFARNEIFVRLLANLFPGKKVYTSEIDNASALGAALVVWEAMGKKAFPAIGLGLTEWKAFVL